jgi:putative transposase
MLLAPPGTLGDLRTLVLGNHTLKLEHQFLFGFSKSTVHRILNEASLKPHKTDYWCGKSPDPEFTEKQAAIIGLYLNPPENALAISVDEKSRIQALDRTQPMLPMKPENPKRFTHTYTRHGTIMDNYKDNC